MALASGCTDAPTPASGESGPTAQAPNEGALPATSGNGVDTAGGGGTQALPPASTGPETQPAPLVEPATVARVIDGDTLELADGSRLRLIGIDTPETVAPNHPVECYGREASAKTRELVEGRVVYLEKDVSETDRFGRLLRYVYLEDGRMLNEVLVAEGYASAASYPPDVKYQDRFLAAERAAREAALGFWGAVCAESPTPTPVPPTATPAPPALAPALPTAPPPAAAPPQQAACHPSYAGACLDPYASDYDCAGGRGDGPLYTGRVTVVGPDVFRLDSDGDGIGCE